MLECFSTATTPEGLPPLGDFDHIGGWRPTLLTSPNAAAVKHAGRADGPLRLLGCWGQKAELADSLHTH